MWKITVSMENNKHDNYCFKFLSVAFILPKYLLLKIQKFYFHNFRYLFLEMCPEDWAWCFGYRHTNKCPDCDSMYVQASKNVTLVKKYFRYVNLEWEIDWIYVGYFRSPAYEIGLHYYINFSSNFFFVVNFWIWTIKLHDFLSKFVSITSVYKSPTLEFEERGQSWSVGQGIARREGVCTQISLLIFPPVNPLQSTAVRYINGALRPFQ